MHSTERGGTHDLRENSNREKTTRRRIIHYNILVTRFTEIVCLRARLFLVKKEKASPPRERRMSIYT